MKYTIFLRIYVGVCFLWLIMLLAACEKDVTDKYDLGNKSQLVLQSFISPQDPLIVVSLHRTQPATGRRLSDRELQVQDAAVSISNGAQTASLTYDAKRDAYLLSALAFPIEAGKTYTVNISASGGMKLSAQTTVPSLSKIAINSHSLKDKKQTYGGDFTSLTYRWSDAPGVENYYRPFAYRVATASGASTRREEFNYSRLLESLVTDTNLDGQELTSNEQVSPTWFSEPFPRPFKLYLQLLVIDKNYYLFHRSLFKQGGDDNPFAEPSLVYTNVAGGVGVFASYNILEQVKEVQ